MKIFLGVLVVIFLSFNVFAMRVKGPLNVDGLKTQFGEEVKLSEDTQHIIFVSEKPASKIMNAKIEQLNFNLDEKPVIYVSDISKMPTMITRMFALPKMKKLKFKMALDRKGEVTKDWPREKGAITVLELSNKAITGIKYLKDDAEVETFLKTL